MTGVQTCALPISDDGQMGSECIYDKRLEDFINSDLKICGQRTVSIVIYCMILINSTPYRDRDMPDEILHSSVGGMTRDKVRVSSAGHDRQLEDPERTMAIYHL